MTTEYQKNCPEISSGDAAGRNSSSFYRSASEAFRFILLAAAVLAVILAFASDIDGIVRGYVNFSYPLGCTLVNYSAGFVRRGLFGEIIMQMNALCQPFLSVVLLTSASLLFLLYLILMRLIRLNVRLAYMLAIIFSPSLILFQRGENILRADALIMSLNFAASWILLHLTFQTKRSTLKRFSFIRMLVTDTAVFLVLAVSALIHELSASLLPPVMMIFFIYVRKLHRTMHFFTVLGLLIALYAVMMGFFKYSDADTIVQSWSGIYQNPDSYKSNPALANTVDESHAMNCLEITKTLLKDCIFAFIPHLFIAAAFPFIVLLLSGITVVHSASSRARKTRCLLLIASVCPLGLCLVGFDYGRWFSFCAMNLMVYSLFIAHKAGRIKSASSAPELIRKIKGAAKQCAVIAVGIILLNYRLGVNGYFDESGLTISDETKVIIDSSSRMFRDLAPLVNRERLIQPKNTVK
ncbi:MAG: hypothetical protein SPL25_03515 [Succinivibrionaceae bacterium]|nr:hypothetical protein [Succinivibrionaceae bacterium]